MSEQENIEQLLKEEKERNGRSIEEIICPFPGLMGLLEQDDGSVLATNAMTKPCGRFYKLGELYRCESYENCRYYIFYLAGLFDENTPMTKPVEEPKNNNGVNKSYA